MAPYPLAYCTNVHAGSNLAEVQEKLNTFAVDVKASYSPNSPMGIGLWLSDATSRELTTGDSLDAFAEWLGSRGLIPFTFNGFPFGNFHQDIVKHDVYQPTWAEDARRDYTTRLATIQARLLGGTMEGSISTLPLGWSNSDASFQEASAKRLIQTANWLSDLEEEAGQLIYVCIEPEPGCCFDRATDVTDFFERWIFRGEPSHDSRMRRYLRVCHDICHSAVMFEGQGTAVEVYRQGGVAIGKVQVSSAIEACFDQNEKANAAVRQQLARFDEPKYLHQTSIVQTEGSAPIFFEDLGQALSSIENPGRGVWRTHFHVPIFLESFEALRTTQGQIGEFFAACGDNPPRHIEVETYAWNVFPTKQPIELADGIAQEMQWLHQQLAASNILSPR